MSTQYTPVPTVLPAEITIVQDVIDKVNAASVNPPLQVLADAIAMTTPLASGGTIAPTGALTLDLASAGTLNIQGGSTHQVNGSFQVDAAAFAQFNSNVLGRLFTPGGSGRANRKPQVITPGAGTTDVDPSSYDTIFATPSVGCSLKITPSLAVAEGDWIEIINESAANPAQVLNPASAPPVGDASPLRSAASNFRSAVYVYAGGVWRMATASPYVAA